MKEKMDKLDFIKIKNFSKKKQPIKGMKGEATEWKTLFEDNI